MKKSFKVSVVAVFASLIFISSTTSSSAVKKKAVYDEACEFAWQVLRSQCYAYAKDFYDYWECLRRANEIRLECERGEI